MTDLTDKNEDKSEEGFFMAGFGGSTGVSKEYVDRAIAQSTAWANNWLTNTSILAYAASVANPSFTTFRTSATSTDVPIANEYYIGTVERYGQNISVKMTTMQDASKMYINNSVNGGSTWTGWKTFLDSQSTAKLKRISVTGVNSTNFMVTGIMAANGITPSKVVGVYINSDSGFNQQPISIMYNNIGADNLYIRTATAPTSGTLNITVAYLE